MNNIKCFKNKSTGYLRWIYDFMDFVYYLLIPGRLILMCDINWLLFYIIDTCHKWIRYFTYYILIFCPLSPRLRILIFLTSIVLLLYSKVSVSGPTATAKLT